ncbi:MAG: S-layer homology domain-containing protein [Clostridia bacterium]|nr:S-layer homology domain-containing protein [Clostridia bacterium]
MRKRAIFTVALMLIGQCMSASAAGEYFSDIEQSAAKTEICRMAEKGILNGVENGLYEPMQIITREQAAAIAARLLGMEGKVNTDFSDVDPGSVTAGYIGAVSEAGIINGHDGKFRPKDYVNFEEFVKILVSSVKSRQTENTGDTIVRSFDIEYLGERLSDEETVKADYDILEISNDTLVFKDLELPEKGAYGSDIKWSSSSEIIESDGTLHRPSGSSEQTVTLSANITKGEASIQKDFSVNVMPCDVMWSSTPLSETDSRLLVPSYGEELSFEFDMTPQASNINALIGFTDRDTLEAAFSQLSMIVRFNPSGQIDVYNNNAYMATEQFDYSPLVTYHIRVLTNVEEQTYSVWVSGEDNVEHMIAKNYKYRGTAAKIESVGRAYVKYGEPAVDGRFNVTSCTIAAPEELTKKYDYNENYVEDETAKNDVFYNVAANSKTCSDIKLPEKDLRGNEIIWFSSDSNVISDIGTVTKELGKNASARLTAVVNNGKRAARSIYCNKEKVSAWAVEYIVSAADMGIINDIMLEEKFNPKMYITREYAAVLADRVYSIIERSAD